ARRGPEAEAAAGQADELLDLEVGVLDVGHDAVGDREQRLARRGEGDVAPNPVEQRRPQLRFEGSDLLAQRRLGDVERLGGAGEVPGAGKGDEVIESL